ncbi:ras GTPase-activating protein-binding protein 1 isoform X2 [Sesamum indicum]|uniref:Ras GTPase-activating protein-binding protein 1 isoform X2 n=1 Tax=Sesamum indicum TaxID=4182 RepID=A0A8M8UT75_SESIN|nr:ras GTPase-activating protein-binding protein 1 isoform X2 [Sesamum indicum]
MANQYAAQVTATQVGSYFVQQYYQVFQQQRDYVHHFYNESSSMVRVDREISESASDMVKIHQLLMSLNFTGIEIKTINSLESWNGGVLVVVTGSVKSRDYNGWRKFVQTFFLAPQEKGYFVLNDMFHFVDEEVVHQTSAPVAAQEQSVDYEPTVSTHLPDPAVSDYGLEDEAAEYVSSVHIEGDETVQEYTFQEHHQQEPEPELEPEPEPEPELEPEVDTLEEETPFEESSPLLQSTVTTVQESQLSMAEPVGEPEKLTYASILRAKGKSTPSISSQPAYTQRRPPTADWNHVSQPSPKQSTPILSSPAVEAVEEALPSQEGESKSVYVRNLPSTVTSLDILQEFKNFGKIKQDGVFLRNRDTGVCYAFVEFEDVQSVQNAIKASPIQLAGRKVYIEERRPNSTSSRGGRSGGRGRGGRGGRASGRGSEQNDSDGKRVRANGFRGA